MPTCGLQDIAEHQLAGGFQDAPDIEERGIELLRRHVLRDRVHHDEVDRLLLHLADVVERADADLGVGRKPRDQPAAHAGRGLGQDQLAAGGRHLARRQGLAAGIVQHGRLGRGDVADDVPRDDLEVQVAMQLAHIDRMRRVVIIDPIVHGIPPSGSYVGTALPALR